MLPEGLGIADQITAVPFVGFGSLAKVVSVEPPQGLPQLIIEEDTMNHKKFLPRIAGLTLAVLFLVACNTSQLPFVSLPAPSPASIPGIDEPLVVERIRYTSYGNTYSGKLEIRIHDAYTEDSLQS